MLLFQSLLGSVAFFFISNSLEELKPQCKVRKAEGRPRIESLKVAYEEWGSFWISLRGKASRHSALVHEMLHVALVGYNLPARILLRVISQSPCEH